MKDNYSKGVSNCVGLGYEPPSLIHPFKCAQLVLNLVHCTHFILSKHNSCIVWNSIEVLFFCIKYFSQCSKWKSQLYMNGTLHWFKYTKYRYIQYLQFWAEYFYCSSTFTHTISYCVPFVNVFLNFFFNWNCPVTQQRIFHLLPMQLF